MRWEIEGTIYSYADDGFYFSPGLKKIHPTFEICEQLTAIVLGLA